MRAMPFGHAKFAQDAQAVKDSLVHLDALALNSRYHEHVKISKALAHVWMSAAMESFWVNFLGELCARVSAAPMLKRRRYAAAMGVFYFDSLISMGDGRKLKRWNKVADFFHALPTKSIPSTAIPYDGRTVRPDHFDLAWKVFSLPGSQFPSPIHKQVLNTLADRRNEIAHGEVDPKFVGGQVSVLDVLNVILKLEDIVENSVICANGRWP